VANEPDARVVTAGGGWLLLTPTAEHTTEQTGAVLARTTTTGDYIATTLVDTTNLPADALVGLSAYGDNENALGASVDSVQTIYLWRREKNNHITVKTLPNALKSPRVYLRMTARDGHLYRFAVSADGRRWQDLGEELDGSYLPPWDRGVRVALTAGGARNTAGRFGFLRIEPSRERR
jgi:beta-xylosidase